MANNLDPNDLARRLHELAERLPQEPAGTDAFSASSVKKLRLAVKQLLERLSQLASWLDPVRSPESRFDPSDPHHAAELVAMKLLSLPPQSLAELSPFHGSGVYALYYRGDHPAYGVLARTEIPVYVGKAEPESERATTPKEQGPKLFTRLSEHAKSIGQVETFAVEGAGKRKAPPLRVADFDYRYIVLPSAYAGATEANLLNQYAPVWNTVCPGFGKHGDSPKTRANTRSEWDTLHPGRKWATREGNKPNPKTPTQIQALILEHCKRYLAS